MSPVLVTGADGFIGSTLLDALSSIGRPARALCGPPAAAAVPGRDVAAERVARADLAAQPVPHDLIDGAAAVVHLAGPASVARSFERPVDYVGAHVTGTARVVADAVAAGVPRLVLVSSAEVYGRPTANPVPEPAATAPRSPYGAAKVGAEAVATAAARRGDLDVVVVRPFSGIGPGMAPWSVLGTLLARAAAGEPLAVADPGPVRDLVHVEDVAAALLAAVEAPLRSGVTVCNACTGVGTSVGDLMALVADVTGTGVAAAPAPADRPAAADLPELVGDPTAAARELGWRARIGVREGVEAMWAGTRPAMTAG